MMALVGCWPALVAYHSKAFLVDPGTMMCDLQVQHMLLHVSCRQLKLIKPPLLQLLLSVECQKRSHLFGA